MRYTILLSFYSRKITKLKKKDADSLFFSPSPLIDSIRSFIVDVQELKRIILDEALAVLVAQVIIPHSGWDRKKPGPTHWTALLRNASGILRYFFRFFFFLSI